MTKLLSALITILFLTGFAWAAPYMGSDPHSTPVAVYQCEVDGVLDVMPYPASTNAVMYDLANVTPGTHTIKCRFGAQWVDNGNPVDIYNWGEWSSTRPFVKPGVPGGSTLTGIRK